MDKLVKSVRCGGISCNDTLMHVARKWCCTTYNFTVKIKKRIRNIDIRLELGVVEMKNDIQKTKLKWFGHVMQMREERVSKKMQHTKIEGK